MHPLRHPRNAALLGFLFVLAAFGLWVVPATQGMTVPYNEVASGVTMLIFLAAAMALMAYVLVAGSRKE